RCPNRLATGEIGLAGLPGRTVGVSRARPEPGHGHGRLDVGNHIQVDLAGADLLAASRFTRELDRGIAGEAEPDELGDERRCDGERAGVARLAIDLSLDAAEIGR